MANGSFGAVIRAWRLRTGLTPGFQNFKLRSSITSMVQNPPPPSSLPCYDSVLIPFCANISNDRGSDLTRFSQDVLLSLPVNLRCVCAEFEFAVGSWDGAAAR